jgi:hypothetical protein
MTKKKSITLFFLILISLSAFSWGATGHRAIGLIAERNLNQKAKKKLQEILGGESLAIASFWMDEVRSDTAYRRMTDWHWVTIETGKSYTESPKNPNGDLIMTIERVIDELKSKKVSGAKEAEYVKILLHLIGDLHQPLHVGCCDDRGGNQVKVKWFGKNTDLHGVWDSEMIDGTKLSYTELADAIIIPSNETILNLQKTGIRDWAKESMDLREQVYTIGDSNLSYVYSYKNIGTVKRRIQEAGIRLAGILNRIYG